MTILALLLRLEPALAKSPGPSPGAPSETPDPPAPLSPNRNEYSLLPAFSADSDRGIGFGALGMMARFEEGYRPFRWRLSVLVYMTAKEAPDGSIELPFHAYHVKLDLPGLQGGKLRLNLSAGFRRFTTSGYFGMGNASASSGLDAGRYHQYDRIYPFAEALLRVKAGHGFQLLAGAKFNMNWINAYDDSKLLEDMNSSDPEIQALLLGTGRHPNLEMILGWIWDSRDHEYTPSRGMFHHLSWRFSPGVASGSDIVYGGINLTTSFFVPLVGEQLVLAARLVVDLLVGQPPFYELARHGGLYPAGAPGGGQGIRGVPLHRYHGKIKLLGNLELRAKLLPFSLFGNRFNLGAVAFFDAGRIWADYAAISRFDGTGAEIKLGLGGGPRLQWGETFVIRIDVGWSPDSEPVGFYFNVRHVF